MSWFWGKKDAQETSNDPYAKLDPSLREYLDKESPLKYADTQPKPNQGSTANSSYRAQLGLDASLTPKPDEAAQPVSPDRPAVPPESLYQDGRYAHLWKTYRPQAEVEAGSKTDADRLADVVAAYNDRKAAIGRAAIANCVEEQLAEKQCLTHGPWASRITMCRDENRAFHRCFNLQSRFLKALGYLALERGPDEEERIQMHADKLYHEMLARERVAAEAKARGEDGVVEEPAAAAAAAAAAAGSVASAASLPPLIQAEDTTRALGEDSAWARARRKAAEAGLSTNLSAYSPERQEEIKKRIRGMGKEEQELELQLIAAETRAQLEYAEKIRERMEEERLHRAGRRERGKETVGDTIKRLWGWDK